MKCSKSLYGAAKRIHAAAFIALLLLIGGAAHPTYAFNWNPDPSEVLQNAKAQNKAALFYFYHPLTLRNDRAVWSHPLVMRYADRFLGAFVDIETKSELAESYNLNVFPSVLFFDPEGRELIAYRYEDEELKRTILASRMKRVLDSIDEFSLVQSQLRQRPDDPRLIFLYARGLRDRSQFEEAERLFQQLFSRDDITADLLQQTKEAHQHLLLQKATQNFYEKNFDVSISTLQRFVSLYPEEQGLDHVNFLMGIAYYEAGDRRNGEQLLNRLANRRDGGFFQEKAKMYLDEQKRKR